MGSLTNDADRGRPVTPAVWGALGIVYVVWGSTYFGISVMVETIPPLVGAGARFLVAGLIIGSILVAKNGFGVLKVPRDRLITALIVGVLLLAGGNGMVGIAEQHISSGLAALLVAAMPLWLVLFRWSSGDRPPFATVTGVLVGLGGMLLLTLSQGTEGGSSAIGVLIMIFAPLSWAVGSFISSRGRMPENLFVATFYEMIAGSLALLIIGFGRGETVDLGQISTSSWIALAYLTTFGSLVSFTSYVWLLGKAPISLVGTYAYVNPAIAVLLGWAFGDEAVTWPILMGGAIIVAGVGLVVSTERRAKPAPEPEIVPVEPAAARSG